MVIRPSKVGGQPEKMSNQDVYQMQSNINMFSKSTIDNKTSSSNAVLHQEVGQAPPAVFQQPQKTLITSKLKTNKNTNRASREGFPDLTRLVEAVLVKRKNRETQPQ